MTPLKITDARAAKLAALEPKAPWSRVDNAPYVRKHPAGILHFVFPGNADLAEIFAESRNALADLLADRATLLDALRQVELASAKDCLDEPPFHGGVSTRFGTLDSRDPLVLAVRDIRALLASAEGGSDG